MSYSRVHFAGIVTTIVDPIRYQRPWIDKYFEVHTGVLNFESEPPWVTDVNRSWDDTFDRNWQSYIQTELEWRRDLSVDWIKIQEDLRKIQRCVIPSIGRGRSHENLGKGI